jgi:hypothetical protein
MAKVTRQCIAEHLWEGIQIVVSITNSMIETF